MTLQFCHRAKRGATLAICFAMCASLTIGLKGLSAQETTQAADQAVEEADTKTVERKEKTKRVPTRVSRTLAPVEGFDSVEMFQAMEAGQIEVRIIPKDATLCTVLVENKSEQPLSIQMPEAFAAVPVLAQAGGLGPGAGGGQGGGGGGRGGGGQGGGGQGGGQGGGGGFGGGQGGGGFGGGGGGGRGGGQGGGGGGGLFNIPAGKSGRVKVTLFCLDHDKRDPKPRDEYVIKPLDSYCKDPAIKEVCKLVANDRISQQVAQAIAWNMVNGVTWEELLAKERKRLMNGYVEMFFTYDQLVFAQRVATEARQYVEQMAVSQPAETQLKTDFTPVQSQEADKQRR